LTKGKDKLPHFMKRKDGNLLLMAGLYDSAVIEGMCNVSQRSFCLIVIMLGRTLWSFTIVTTDANKEFSWLHDRQPVFLTNKAALDKWLDTTSQTWTKELSDMVLQPYHDTTVSLEW
jgi:putative SOS response-associated peptidase YedK